MKKIIVSVTNDIVLDQRVAKICETLHNNGYEICLIGRKLKTSLPLKRSYQTIRMKLIFNNGFLFYAEYNIRLFLRLLVSKKNILLSNDLDTLLANFLISKLQQKKLVFDSHELFSEIPELVNKPKTKQFWKFLENKLIPKLKNGYTVCKSIADYYKTTYNSNFEVIRNLPKATRNLKIVKNKNYTIIYQGALNVGRGIELMLKTMQFLDNVTLLIIGDGDISKKLKEKSITLSVEKKVFFAGKKLPKDLKKITPTANLGISFEEDLGLNYRFALPNKVFDYIQAEIPVLVSDLPEMKNLVLTYNIGEIIEHRTPEKIAVQIKKIMTKDFSSSIKKTKKKLIWEIEEKKLLNLFKNLM